jgi:hypothetical protein
VVYGRGPGYSLPDCSSANGRLDLSVDDVSLVYNHGCEYNLVNSWYVDGCGEGEGGYMGI